MNSEKQKRDAETLQEIDTLINKGDVQTAIKQLHTAMETGVTIAPHNINLAHKILVRAEWKTITSLLPTGTNFFLSSGWLQSIIKSRPINNREEPVPWFTYPAIDFLDNMMDKDWNVFEWGSGNSTMWWAKRTQKITAIEDNSAWYKEVRHQLPENANILLFEKPEEYVKAVYASGEKYDVIVVDGTNRNECSVAASKQLKDGGILIFDNSDVKSHQAAQEHLKKEGFYRIDFWGLIPSYLYKNCTSIYFKDPCILKPGTLPHEHCSSVGLSCSQALEQRK